MRRISTKFTTASKYYGKYCMGMRRQLFQVTTRRSLSHSVPSRMLTDQEMEEEHRVHMLVEELSSRHHRTMSMKQLINFGLHVTQSALVESANWLCDELKIRLAKQVKYLKDLPGGLNLMPSVCVVRDWYIMSFKQLLYASPPRNADDLEQFNEILRDIYNRHSPTSISLARGAHELKKEYGSSVYKSEALVDFAPYTELHEAMDKFYINRIGMFVLIGQHLELQKQLTDRNNNNNNSDNNNGPTTVVGLICLNTNPRQVIEDAVEDAKLVCERFHLDVPEVNIHTPEFETRFPYVPSSLYYVIFELVKNSMRATCEAYGGKSEKALPPIDITIADSEDNEDICIRISDRGGGIARSHLPKVWSYLFTTAPLMEDPMDNHEAPLAGLGYGLALSRLHCQYWGGSLQLYCMESYGCDAYIHLNKSGEIPEPSLD